MVQVKKRKQLAWGKKEEEKVRSNQINTPP